VTDRAPQLHPAVAADGQDTPVDDERGADRDPALGATDPRLFDRGLEKLLVAHLSPFFYARR
jgi:hypothetical protein